MPLHRFPPRLWEALRRERGLCARLPGHYLRRLREEEAAAPAPVHWRPRARQQRLHPQQQEAPVLPRLPPESQQGLWGGEGWVVGFRYANNDKLSARVKKIWKPQLFHRELYSEILDKRLRVTVTMRTLDQIDAAYGFDFYILKVTDQPTGLGEAAAGVPPLGSSSRFHPAAGQAALLWLNSVVWGPGVLLRSHASWAFTLFRQSSHRLLLRVSAPAQTPKAELCSKLGMDLKRTMLLRLARQDPSLHPDDPARREAVYHKYREFVIPEEEAEWVGLSLEEALEKQRLLEKKDPVPLFKVYVEELVQQLQAQKTSELAEGQK
ncbi:hypothetical protein lerEdw1_004569 [Lerista edwardsae]|nr:hypothetical protein lerEdw1_004569 [Lerista edwardsae]